MDFEAIKKEYETQRKIARTYSFNLSLGALLIVNLALATYQIVFGGSGGSAIGIAALVLAIFAHVYNVKVKISYLASIFVYVINGLSIFLIPLYLNPTPGSSILVILIGLAMVALEILAIVFSFITASKYKKQHPTLSADFKAARKAYQDAKKTQD